MLFRQFSRKYCSSFNPKTLDGAGSINLSNFVNGSWVSSKWYTDILDPLNGEKFIRMPNTSEQELGPFIERMRSIPKSGLHNPLRSVERYNLYGDVTFRLARALDIPAVEEHFALCIQRVAPKSYSQCLGEVRVVKAFLKNFGGDQVRFLAKGFHVSGDHLGQQSQGYRWPYG